MSEKMNEEQIADRLAESLDQMLEEFRGHVADGGDAVPGTVSVFGCLGEALTWFRAHGRDAKERHARFERVCGIVEGFDARLRIIEEWMNGKPQRDA